MISLHFHGRIGVLLALAVIWALPALSCGEAARQSSADSPPAAVQPVADGMIASPEPDWPQWHGTRRDSISQEKGLLTAWPEGGPPLLWKIDNLGRGWSSPIIVRDRIYITGDVDDDLVIFAFDLGGKLQWKATNGKAWTGSFPGARACCVFSEGKLYNMNAHGRVACLDAANGKELWSLDMLERFQAENITWALSECLLVDGPRLIVTPGGAKALMAAHDKHTGRVVWTTEPLDEDRTSHSAPILFRHAGRRVLANCSSAHGFGVDADTGKLLWTVPLRNRYGTNVASPVYGDGNVFFVTAYVQGACYRLESVGEPPQGRAALEHHARHMHRKRAVGRRRAPWQRLYQAQVVARDRLEVGQDPLRVQGPDDRRRRLGRRPSLLPGGERSRGLAKTNR